LHKLPNYKKSNPLDKWIISELNKLTYDVSSWFDNYKLNEATRPIVAFMDNLTNWYIRRSRKRFWKSENDTDKIEAYNTLYEVLVELSKIISPFMPFVSESIYKNLTKNESVHLDMFPETNPSFILEQLSKDMDLTQKVINLWLAARANAKLRVRQPLSYIKITEELSDYYLEIIKEELNIKAINIFKQEEKPKKICKPNGRNIWPKFGTNVKFIMEQAKTWNFKELENGNILVWEFELENGDFEIVFEATSDNKTANEIIESWFGTVISLCTQLDNDLINEWYARDIVRQIQEARKQADFEVSDRIQISISGENVSSIIEKFSNYIETETLSKIVQNIDTPNLEKDLEIEDLKIKLKIKK